MGLPWKLSSFLFIYVFEHIIKFIYILFNYIDSDVNLSTQINCIPEPNGTNCLEGSNWGNYWLQGSWSCILG